MKEGTAAARGAGAAGRKDGADLQAGGGPSGWGVAGALLLHSCMHRLSGNRKAGPPRCVAVRCSAQELHPRLLKAVLARQAVMASPGKSRSGGYLQALEPLRGRPRAAPPRRCGWGGRGGGCGPVLTRRLEWSSKGAQQPCRGWSAQLPCARAPGCTAATAAPVNPVAIAAVQSGCWRRWPRRWGRVHVWAGAAREAGAECSKRRAHLREAAVNRIRARSEVSRAAWHCMHANMQQRFGAPHPKALCACRSCPAQTAQPASRHTHRRQAVRRPQ